MAENPSAEWKRNALGVIEKLKARVKTLEARQDASIAIVGLACRFPGAPDAASFWNLLEAGREGVVEVPRERWNIEELYDPDPDAPGRMYTRYGAFLDQVDRFDAGLFGISPREALSMDPQQRILLETAWEALENAGIAPLSLKHSRTGVFAGVGSNEYAQLLTSQGLEGIDAWYGAGNAANVIAGRLAFSLGLEGPAMAIDTACSSSLVAMHQACQALRSGDCDLALSGGVNLMLSPATTIATCRARMLAADGRCKTFDASADGYVRGEGCGIVVLKRLAEAERDGDRILAVIRGSAVNQDGASSGLTVPNGPAQERVIAQALVQAGLAGSQVDYLEAHGTGTSLGDPIEVRAAASVFGRGRSASDPLLIGSLKTNIGHLEAASGIAGLIKLVLSMRHGTIPRHLHLRTPNPHIRWDQIAVRVTTNAVPWPKRGEFPIAGVSSFGFSGTNAHVIVEGRPGQPSVRNGDHRHVLLLSAKSEAALGQQIQRYGEWLERNPEADLAGMARTAAVGRSHLEYRAAFLAGSREELRSALAVRPAGRHRTDAEPTCAWLFRGADVESQLELARQWESWGIEPDVLMGYGPGQSAAARVAGTQRTLLHSPACKSEESVRFADNVRGLAGQGVTVCLEMGNRPMARAVLRYWPEDKPKPVFIAAARREEAIAALYEAGLAPGAAAWPSAPIVDLPAYPFQRASYWPQKTDREHPFAGTRHVLASSGETLFVSEVSGRTHPYLRDHIIQGRQVMPATGFAALVMAAAGVPCRLTDVVIMEPLLLRGDEQRPLQMRFKAEEEAFEIHTQAGEQGWRLHCRGRVERLAELTVESTQIPSHLPERDVAEFFSLSTAAGLLLGPAFQGIERLWATADEALGEIAPPRGLAARADMPVHPAVLDACSQVAGALISQSDPGILFLPVQYRRLELLRPLPERFFCYGRFSQPPSTETRQVDLLLIDPSGELLGQFAGFVLKKTAREQLFSSDEDRLFYRMAWHEWKAPERSEFTRGDWLVLGVDEAIPVLTASGCRCFNSLSAIELAECQGVVAGSWDAALPVLQELSRRAPAPPRGVFLITRGTWSVGASKASSPDGGLLWGFGRSVQTELPGLRCCLIDLDAEGATAGLREALREENPPPQQAWRGAVRYVPRLERTAEISSPGTRVERGSCWLITGGLGSVGRKVALWLAAQGAGHVVVVGRGTSTESAAGLIAELAVLGCEGHAFAADVSQRGDVDRLWAELAGLPPLQGIMHAAGVLDDGVLAEQNGERFERVLTPKVAGAWNLHLASLQTKLDHFVLFSSISAAIGSAGQSNYAAANGYLDALAEYRQGLGLPAMTVHWGPWSEGGMASDRRVLSRLSRQGLEPLPAAGALAALGTLLASGSAEATVLKANWKRYADALGSLPVPDVLENLVPRRMKAKGSRLLEILSALPPDKQSAELEAQVGSLVGKVLGLPGQPQSREGFFNLGMDSLTAVELTNHLQGILGDAHELSSTAVFDYPTVAALSGHLAEKLLDRTPKRSGVRTRRTASASDPIAIVGVSGRFPKGSDLAEFWELLIQGRDGIEEVPADRWDIDAFYDPDPDAPGKMTTRFGGFLRGIDQFEPGFFSISPREAESMDPQHRMLLETSWHALEDAGIAPSTLVGTQAGVFIGISTSDYTQLLSSRGIETIDQYFGSGNSHSTAAGRLSFVFGLEGPCFTVDTACSASLVALNQACKALQSGDCDLALTGGVNALLIPGTTVYFSKARMMAPDGRCKTFDASADGYVRGEGCGVVVLKRLSDAQRDGDRIWALVRGSAVNQDGRSSGLTVPNGPAQERVIQEALAQAGIAPAEVSYVEAHGTGTALGDPIELTALQSVFGPERDQGNPLLIGSVKTNIGHLEAAAGMAGLIKVLLAMRHGKIPPHVNFQKPTPRVPWDKFALRVVTEPVDWPLSRKIAGLSSFAFSGTNTHVVIEAADHLEMQPRAAAFEPVVPLQLVLSARSQRALASLAGRYEALLTQQPDVDLADLCYTAATGRMLLEQRAILEVESVAHACQLLRKLRLGESSPSITTGAGINVDLTRWDGIRRRKVELPLYPFEHQRCWPIDSAPLLANEQQLATGQSTYSSRISMDTQPWLADHRVFGEVIAPGAMYISLAASAAGTPCRMRRGSFTRAMQFSKGSGGREVQLLLNAPDERGSRGFQVFSRANKAMDWTTHAQGSLERMAEDPRRHDESLSSLRTRLTPAPVEELFEFSAAVGIEFGPAFRGITRLWVGDGEALAEIRTVTDLNAGGLVVHPATLDCVLQLVGAAIRARTNQPHVPFEFERFDLYRNVPSTFFCYARVRDGVRNEQTITSDLWMFTEAGDPVGEIEAFVARRASAASMLEQQAEGIEDLLYEIELREQPSRFWPAPEAIATTVREWSHSTGAAAGLASEHRRLSAELEHRSRRHIAQALAEVSEAAALPRYRRLFESMRKIAAQPAPPPLGHNGHGETHDAVEMALLERCGASLAEVLRGNVEPLSLLFPAEGVSAEDLYGKAPRVRLFNEMAGRAVETALRALPAGRRLRVLEIGAGTGGTTASILPVLPADRTEYVYTDISAAFFTGAEKRFAQYPFIQHRVLDIEREPREQGFLPHQFDIVLAANVLHATRDIEETLAHIRELIAPAGLLMILEGLEKQTWLDLTFGLLDGWWRFEDKVRTDHALLSREQWRNVLEGAGFETPEAVSPEAIPEHAVLITRAGSAVVNAGATCIPATGDLHADCATALSLIQDAAQGNENHDLLFVTQGADPSHAPLRGLAKTAGLEHPELRCRIVDFDGEVDRDALESERAMPGDEDHVVYRQGRRFVPRLVRKPRAPELPSGDWRLYSPKDGGIEGLQFEALRVTDPGPGEVQVEVHASGLNFRDLLEVMGALPVSIGPLGGEFSGRILAVGADVAGFEPGQMVIGFGNGTFSRRLNVPVELVAAMPERLSDAEAAGLPIAFATARLAFERAGLKPGQRVLIHAATGGLGLAAVQLALSAGAEVYATASKPKHGYLRSLGIRHIYNSRSTGFAAEILEETGGEGVDLALNSLTGDGFIESTLRALASGGRFLECSKRSVWPAEKMAAVRPDVRYEILALDGLLLQTPARAGEILRDVARLAASGEVRPLPTTVVPVARAQAGFEMMRRAEHIGKIVFSIQSEKMIRFDPDRAYLISGGTGGLGIELSRWMAERGARILYLNGRHRPSAEAERAIEDLHASGVKVHVVLGDIGEEADVQRILAGMEAPLDGVFHLAGVLRDGTISRQTEESFTEVLKPKADGAWHLHRATEDRGLRWFVLFSSTASILGNSGQANHAAANSFLDALAHYRRSIGLPAVSINWGAWSETGSAAQKDIAGKLETLGMDWIAPRRGLRALEEILASAAVQQVVLPIRWDLFRRQLPQGVVPPLLRELIASPAAVRVADHSALLERLKETPAAGQPALIQDFVAGEVKQVLHLGTLPDVSTGFFDLGMDSLMAVELRNRLNRELQLDPPLSSTVLFDHSSATALAAHLMERLGTPAPPSAAEDDLPDLTADELSKLLETRLAAVFLEER